MGKRILFLSDFSIKGSGYLRISAPLCEGLSNLGYEVKALGIRYEGEENHFNFSLIPCSEYAIEYVTMIENLTVLWPFDALIVAADIPVHEHLLNRLSNRKFKYVAITPLEMGPLSLSWAAALSLAEKVFFISELGKLEAKKVGLDAEHLVVSINTDLWFPMTIEEKKSARAVLGYTENDLIVLVVADNQERKNLSAAYQMLNLLKQRVDGVSVKMIVITVIHNRNGWRLDDVKYRYNISPQDVVEYDRGMSAEQLRVMYCIADVFYLPTKAEGLGLPVLEAMACGTPVVATNTGAITELLSDGRGQLVDYEYEVDCDVWGCSKRRFISPVDSVNKIAQLFSDDFDVESMLRSAREYVVNRTGIKMVSQIADAVEELCK